MVNKFLLKKRRALSKSKKTQNNDSIKKAQATMEVLIIMGVLVVGVIIFGTFYFGNIGERSRGVSGTPGDLNESDLKNSYEKALIYDGVDQVEMEGGSSHINSGGDDDDGGGTPVCNNNGTCDSGETINNCPSDCSPLMLDTGAQSPNTVISETFSDVMIPREWVNADNAKVSDNLYASTPDYAPLGIYEFTEYLKATDFGFSIPSNATINGIKVEIEKLASDIPEYNEIDYRVRIVNADGTIGNTAREQDVDWPMTDTDTYVSYGGSDDLWGEEWISANINDSDFGVVISGLFNDIVFCLNEDSLVSTKSGNKKIKNLNIGEKVLSYDSLENKLEYKPIIKIRQSSMSNANNRYFYIYYNNGELIKATANHEFYIDGVYKRADQLEVGDKLLDLDLKTLLIEKIEIIENTTDTVWDIEVEDNHNFFANGILVHNAGGDIPITSTNLFIDHIRMTVYYTVTPVSENDTTILVFDTTKTSTGSSGINQIKLPLEETGVYNFNVDWNDGTNSNITSWGDENVTHTYSEPGIYEIKITGEIKGFRFNYSGDKEKLREIKNWGNLNLGNSGNYFSGCSNLNITATDVLDLNGTTNLSGLFGGCSNLVFNDSINSWDVSNVTDMSNMFSYALLFNQPLSSWNVSQVENMESMFFQALAFNQSLTDWNTITVTNMSQMFNSARAFNSSISDWNTSRVTNMEGMFWNAEAFNQPLNNWDVSNVTDMSNMFLFAYSFNQPLNNWDVSNVETMSQMFVWTLYNFPLNNWDVSNVINMQGMFLVTPFNQDISSWNVEKVTNWDDIFKNCRILPEYKPPKFK